MEELTIQWIQPQDLDWVLELFVQSVYPGDPQEAHTHFAGHMEGLKDTFLAFVQEGLAGYLTISWQSENPLFRRENIPLIHHLAVFPAFQRRGIASRLMEEGERLIATRSRKAGITVGLFDAYGPAQRLYAKRGYLPDGRGVCQGQRPLRQGETVTLDHDLILWMTKDLSTDTTQEIHAEPINKNHR